MVAMTNAILNTLKSFAVERTQPQEDAASKIIAWIVLPKMKVHSKLVDLALKILKLHNGHGHYLPI